MQEALTPGVSGARNTPIDATRPALTRLQQGQTTGVPVALLAHVRSAEAWRDLQGALQRLVVPADCYLAVDHDALDHVDAMRSRLPKATIWRSDALPDMAIQLQMLRQIRPLPYSLVLTIVAGVARLPGSTLSLLRLSHIEFQRSGDIEELLGAAPRIVDLFVRNPRLGLVGHRAAWRALAGDAAAADVQALGAHPGFGGELPRQGYFSSAILAFRPQALDRLLDSAILAGNTPPDEIERLASAVERSLPAVAASAGFTISDLAGQALSEGRRASEPWLLANRGLVAERTWAREECSGWAAASPRITLAVPMLRREGALGHTTLADDPWCELLRAQPIPGDRAEQILRDSNHALLGSDAQWVGLLEAGDRLADDAAFRLAVAIRRNPHWQLLYCDEDAVNEGGQHLNPHCKPDFNLDYLRSLPYIGGLLLIRRDLFDALGGFDPAHEGAEDYDLLLRAWEYLQRTGAGESAIGHLPEVLYHRRVGSGHTRKSVPELLAAGQAALQAHFDRLGIAAQVQPGPFPPSFRVRWPLPQNKPLVSILIPTRDQLPMLQRCIESVIEKTRYPAYEILIIDNDSSAGDAVRYLAAIDERKAELGDRLRVIRTPGPFNFSAMNNTAARAARGEYLLLLNNDTAALHDDWLDEMMSHAVRPDVGVVGAKLLFPDGRIQHAGVILGIRGPAEHPFIGRPPEDRGYFGRAQLVQDLSAVTGACLLVRKSVFEQVGGLDEKDLKVSYSDIDLCLKVRQAGLRVVFDPYALLMHEGSASQNGKVEQKPDEAKQARFAAERQVMYDRWLPLLARDPAYNRHLSLATTEFQLDDQACLAWDPDWRPRPRILVHPADREGCGEYRIIAPMRALNRAGRTQGWETMRLFDPAEMERIQPDSLVVQRQMEWPQIEALERHARHSKAFRVFELDDLITNLPLKSVHRQHIHKDIAKRFRKAAGLCNRLVVATEPLRQAYADYCDEVVVCPNYLEAARWGELRPARAERSRLRVGWAGGIGHAGDLELIADVVRETASTVDWIFFGMCPDSLKDVVHEFHPGIPLDQYAPKLASLDLDLAVAPLEHNAFNEAKSHLRLLEYGVLGYPVICTDIVPYQGDFPVTRVANRFRDWTRAILDAAADPAALRAQGDALRDKVLAEWMLEDHLDTWVAAWTR